MTVERNGPEAFAQQWGSNNNNKRHCLHRTSLSKKEIPLTISAQSLIYVSSM